MSKEIKTRPSSLVGIKDPFVAFCFDEAILVGGTLIQAELEKITSDKPATQARRREAKLHQLLGIKKQQKFRTPKLD